MAKRVKKTKLDDWVSKMPVDKSLNQHIKEGHNRIKVTQSCGEQVAKELAEMAKNGIMFGVKR